MDEILLNLKKYIKWRRKIHLLIDLCFVQPEIKLNNTPQRDQIMLIVIFIAAYITIVALTLTIIGLCCGKNRGKICDEESEIQRNKGKICDEENAMQRNKESL